MTLFGRELTLEQLIGFVKCNAAPTEDLVHMAAVEIIAALQDTQRREKAAVDDLTAALKQSTDDICSYCKNTIKCNGKDCEFYEAGTGASIGETRYPDFKWTCMDFNFGTCTAMEKTPCFECFDNDYSGFEWRGPVTEEEG